MLNILSNGSDQGAETVSSVFLNRLYNSSNQLIDKNSDGSIQAVRYVIAAETSCLRSVKGWVIDIDDYYGDCEGRISSDNILSVHIRNEHSQNGKKHLIKKVMVRGNRICRNLSLDPLMAAFLIISKIDAGRMPDIDRILSLHNL
jgi:hypothetical protein